MKKLSVFLCAIITVFVLPGKDAKVVEKRATALECDSNAIANVKHCCSLPELLHEDIGTFCTTTLKNMTFLPEETNNCFYECMLNTIAILTPTGAINATKARSNLVTLLMPAVWRTVIYDAINECSNKINATISTWTKEAETCDPRSGLFLTCIGQYEGVNCPSQFGKTSTSAGIDCLAIAKNLKECSLFTKFEKLKEEEK